MSFCIVGAGITGLCFLLLLREAGHDLRKVSIVDPHFDGGDLARRWTTVISNTPWSKTWNALHEAAPSLSLLSHHPPESTTPLVEIAHLIRRAATECLALVQQIQGWATQAEFNEATSEWSVTIRAAGKGVTVKAAKLILAQGGDPRSLNLPIPSLPLEIALDRRRIQSYVSPGSRVMVVGTMHSGTLVLRNIAEDCSASAIGLYNTAAPFVWDRDGAYDGLKAEAAEIADAITRGDFKGRIEMAPVTDTSGMMRAARTADWVVYAMGFAPRDSIRVFVGGEEQSAVAYDGETGKLSDVPAAWGFGTAYPNRAPDGVHWDVSVAAFLAHIKRQMPTF